MSNFQLSVAVGNYDRIGPLIDGEVQIDGVDPVFMLQDPDKIFFRALRHADSDICELSLSRYSVKTAAATSLLPRGADLSLASLSEYVDLYAHR